MPISPSLITHAEITINGTVSSAGGNSRPSQSVWHYRRVSTAPVLSKLALKTIFNTTVMVPLIACLSIRYSGQTVFVRWLDDAQDANQSFTGVNAGAIIGDSMPTNVSVFLLMGTGLRGKNFRGSKKLFPIGESATTVATDDILNAGALTYFGTLATGALANLTDTNGNVWTPCVLSRKLSQLRVNPTNVITNDITSVAVRKSLGHMRHRQIKAVY